MLSCTRGYGFQALCVVVNHDEGVDGVCNDWHMGGDEAPAEEKAMIIVRW